MKLLVLLAVLLPAVFCAVPQKILMAPEAELWKAWTAKYNKEYDTMAEEVNRFEIWLENLEKVQTHNIGYDLGLHTFDVELNEFADMSLDEIHATRMGYKKAIKAGIVDHSSSGVSVPDSVDWRTEGYVTAVKNQGNCGSCWAFSTTGGLEGQHYNATKNLVSLSEQQLVDCDSACYGCGGGWVEAGYNYLVGAGSISESDYPYTSGGGKSGSCQSYGKSIAATLTKYQPLPYGNEDSLKEAAGSVGPISVAIDASQWSFSYYKSGVYYDAACSSYYLDHAVLVAGYGTYSGQDYWLVKNSWGSTWGLQGYIMMSRNRNNNCGIASDALYPIV